MNKINDFDETQKKDSNTKNGINLDYDYNSEYGDGDIPDSDKNSVSDNTKNCNK